MVGQTIAHYKITDKLGEGGMGVVYKAEDLKLGRAVALKFLPSQVLESGEQRSRFLQEARAAALIDHPNICTVYAIEEVDGQAFLVMACLEGQTLKQKIAARPLPIEAALDIATQIGEGLQAAHEKGVVHRDIKPANIMVSEQGRVKIMDFGLAQLNDRTGLTAAGTRLGTPSYMSPEQAEGKPTDCRSDIWGLAVVLYEMVSGRVPFAGEAEAAVTHAILCSEPEPLTALRSGLSISLDRVVAKALAKKPAERYQHVDDMLVDLRTLAPTRVDGPIRRRARPRWAASAAAALMVVAAAVSFVWYRNQRVDSLAVLPFASDDDPDTEYLSEGITENLINSLSELPTLRVTARSLAFRYQGPRVDPQKAGQDLHVRAVLTGRVVERDGTLNVQAELMNVDDGAQLWGGQYTRKSSEILALQQEIARAVSGKLNVERNTEHEKRLAKRSTENTEAYHLYLKGRYYWNRRSEHTLKRAVEYFRQAIDKDPGYALAYAGLADCYALYNSYQVELPREAGLKAKAAALKALEIDNTLAEAHASLGMTRMSYEWDWAGAEREFQRAIELDPSYATAHHWYAICLTATGRSDQAIASLKRAQQADPLSLIINADMGLVLHFARREDEAIEQLRKTFELDPNQASGRRHLGMVYEQKRMYREAIAEFQKSLEISGGNPFAMGSLGHAYAVSGNTEKAREALSEVSELSKSRYVSPFAIALIYMGLGDNGRALENLEKASDDRSLDMIFLGVDPRFDNLRADPRFSNLLRRMRLL